MCVCSLHFGGSSEGRVVPCSPEKVQSTVDARQLLRQAEASQEALTRDPELSIRNGSKLKVQK